MKSFGVMAYLTIYSSAWFILLFISPFKFIFIFIFSRLFFIKYFPSFIEMIKHIHIIALWTQSACSIKYFAICSFSTYRIEVLSFAVLVFLRYLLILSLSAHISQKHFLLACLSMHVLTIEASLWSDMSEHNKLAARVFVLKLLPPFSSVPSVTCNLLALVIYSQDIFSQDICTK